jgi:hypothetical protein
MKQQTLAIGMPANLLKPEQKAIGMHSEMDVIEQPKGSKESHHVLKHLPPVSRRNIRDSLYGVFLCSYAHWQKFARFIANGQYQNLFEDGKTPSPETRMYWVTKIVDDEEMWLKTLNTRDANDYELKEGEIIRVAISFNMAVRKVAFHEQYRNLGAEHATQKKYNGYVCCIKGDINKLQQNIRSFIKFNPEYSLIFNELPNYAGIYNHNLPIINNEQ